jgi:ABC-type transport system involved in multi-copper enzyme maturation permease subunit
VFGPIFMREFVTVPRRSSHYVARALSLGLLWMLALTAWQATVGFHRTATLGQTARFGLLLFQIFAYVELVLVLFFAALSAASAVAQEKDRRTFILLLLTDMRDSEIVLGKLLGALLPISLILLGTLPVFALLLLLGGVAPHQLVQAVLILASTAFAAGSLGGLVALWRERTFQALALSVLFLVLYLCLVHGLAVVPAVTGLAPGPWHTAQAWLEPFLALQSVLEPAAAGSAGEAIAPAYGFTLVMVLASVLLNGTGIVMLRRWNPSGEPIMQREAPEEVEEKDRTAAHAAPGAVRTVWPNPILWREVRTLAYGRRPVLVKVAYAVALALICYYAFSSVLSTGGRPAFAAAYGLLPVAILSLLLVSAQAVTAITSERDGGALDLLLVTDLSPREFIFGKLLGIAYNTKEYLLPPLILAVVYAAMGLLATPPRNQPELGPAVNAEMALSVVGGLAVLLGFAAIVGLHVALRTTNSRLAIVNTLGTIFFLSVGTLVCIYLILINSGNFRYQWISFALFLATGIGGLWWVLSADRPSNALTLAAFLCPLAMFYCVTNVLVAKPGSEESTDPLLPFLVLASAFGFTISAMLVPLLSEFDVALGRTTAQEE